MRVHEYAKELSTETGKTITSSQVLTILSKKKEGLKATSTIDDELMAYVRAKFIKPVEKKPEPNKHLKPAPRKTQQRTEPPRQRPRRPMPVTGGPVKPSEKKPVRPAVKRPEENVRTAETASVQVKPAEPAVKPEKAEVIKTETAVTPVETVTEVTPVVPAETPVEKETPAVVETAETEAEKKSAETVKEEKAETAEKAEDKAEDKDKAEVKDKAEDKDKAEVKETAEDKDKAEVKENAEDKEKAEAVNKTEAHAETKKEESQQKPQRIISSPIQEQQRPVKILDAKTIAERVAASQSRREAQRKDKAADGSRQDGRRNDGKGDRGPRPDRGTRPDGRDGRDGKGSGRPDGRPENRGRDDRRDGRDGRDSRDGRASQDQRFANRGSRNDRAAAPVADAPAEKFGKDRRDRHEKNRQDKDKFDRKESRERLEPKSRDELRGKKNQKQDKKTQGKSAAPAPKVPEEPVIRNITLPETLTLKELADKLKQPVNAMIKKLFMEGKMVTVNTELSFEDASMIALEYNFIAEEEEKIDLVEEAIRDIEDPEDSLTPRPPVVCVMGHVDHGKTSLLDAIRNSSITQDEAGGITQHIGAYVVKANDQRITFLDTPGHEAFTAMRLRGAQATDIAILVVAADDGVMPQTVEAINHAKAAGIEIIVAVNKIDKPSANVERVKQELMEYGLVAEEWGGSTIFCPVSAHTHEGISNLLDMILLTAEVLELKANANRRARGVVIEARLDRGRGAVATLLVQKGTLHVGDFVAIGEVNGRVRAMLDHKQRNVKEATPSTPVEIIGLSGVPNSGDTFISTDTEKEARSISEAYITRGKENLLADTKSRMSLDDLFNQMQEGSLKELKLVIKADVQGSVEAVKQSLLKLSNDEIVIKCIHSGVGAINESDVTLASASGAIIIGFNVRPDAQAKQLSDEEKVDVRLYKVIYNAIDDIESAMKGMLDPIYEERITGHAEVRQVYKASGIGSIAGSYVLDGVIERGSSARITRDGEQIFQGKISSLKRFKDDVKEVRTGYECGMVFDGHNDLAEGDLIEIYKMVEVPR